jgi:Rieske 2Fe-2S family protein
VICQFLFHPESISQTGFDPGQAIEFWDMTNRQDWEVCELVQRGMSDPAYVPGPYSNLESVVAAFDRHYLDRLGKYQQLAGKLAE